MKKRREDDPAGCVGWGGRAGRGGVGGGSTGSSQCWSVAQHVHSSLLPPTMASVASDEDVFAQFKQQSRKQYINLYHFQADLNWCDGTFK